MTTTLGEACVRETETPQLAPATRAVAYRGAMAGIPLVLIPGRIGPLAENVRGDAFAFGQRYARAVVRAGGQAVMVPPITESLARITDLVARIDAVILHGGGDIDPALYGEEPADDSLYGIVPEHDALEIAVLEAGLARDIPVLAICRGAQLLNVALGGSLVQNIGNEDHWFRHHPVTLDYGSHVAEAMGTLRPTACHSVHHQALKSLGRGVAVTGRADDGVVEAVELAGHRWVVGVQWHPEDTAADDPVQQSLFDTLVAQA
jgi:putative glutamine amidotransferase